MKLPDKKSEPIYDFDKETFLLYGDPGVGKTTLASMFPGAIFASTEPGTEKMSVYGVPINSWPEFKELCSALIIEGTRTKELKLEDKAIASTSKLTSIPTEKTSKIVEGSGETPHYNVLVVDTVDILFLLCRKFMCKGLGVTHESDSKWGKGWDVIGNEWRFVISSLKALDMGLIFISHCEIEQVEAQTRSGSSYSRFSPSLTKRALADVSNYVNFILYLHAENTANGIVRTIKAEPSQNYVAKARGVYGIPLLSANVEMSYDALKANYMDNVNKIKGKQHETDMRELDPKI